jgi:hypothetical protein
LAPAAQQGAQDAPQAQDSSPKKIAPKAKQGAKQTKPQQDAAANVREGSKKAQVIDILKRDQGATNQEIRKATGWQAHSHKDSRLDLWELRDRGSSAFESYQNGQTSDVFGQAQYVVSFIAERNRYAKFVGVWEVLSKRKAAKGFRYRTKELRDFKGLEGSLIIYWGEGARSWSQWLHRQGNKEVVEILPPNSVSDFRGYYDFHLQYDELRKMIDHPDSNREWQRMLSAVSCQRRIPHCGPEIREAVRGQRVWQRRNLVTMEELCEFAVRGQQDAEGASGEKSWARKVVPILNHAGAGTGHNENRRS